MNANSWNQLFYNWSEFSDIHLCVFKVVLWYISNIFKQQKNYSFTLCFQEAEPEWDWGESEGADEAVELLPHP